jgi:hypothetical protein
MFRARQLAAASATGGDETGWFEQRFTRQVPALPRWRAEFVRDPGA